MKTVTLNELADRRVELLGSLAQGESFAVIDAGQEVAVLRPPRPAVKPALTGSVLDLIADLIGTVDGPTDLSDKKKHLEGYDLDGAARRAMRASQQDRRERWCLSMTVL